MMHPQPGQVQGGLYGVPPGSSAIPPMQQMSSLSLGRQGHQQPPGQSFPNYGPPLGGMSSHPNTQMKHAVDSAPPSAGNFPLRSSLYNQPPNTMQSQVGGAIVNGPPVGNFPLRSSQYSQPLEPGGNITGSPPPHIHPTSGQTPGPGQGHPQSFNQMQGHHSVEPRQQPPSLPTAAQTFTSQPLIPGQVPLSSQNLIGQPPKPVGQLSTGPQMMGNMSGPPPQATTQAVGQIGVMGNVSGPPPQMMHPGMVSRQPPPLKSGPNNYMGTNLTGSSSGHLGGPGGSGGQIEPPRVPMGPPGSTGMSVGSNPPEMSVGPGQSGPPGMSVGGQLVPPGMSTGPIQSGPPGVPLGGQLGPPGMSMGPRQSGPPGMSMGPGQSRPSGMSTGGQMGPPGMPTGPGQSGPPGMSSGGQMGPPRMPTGPGQSGMSSGGQMGPPGMPTGPGQSGPPGMSSGGQMGPPGMPTGPGQFGPPGMPPTGHGQSGLPGMSMGGQLGPPGSGPPIGGQPGMPMGLGPPRMGPPGSPGMSLSPGQPGMHAGPMQQQPKSKIDPDLMPNPVEVMKADQEQHGSNPYRTTTQGIPPPLVTTTFTVQDDGNVSPRYMRATMYTVPCSKDLLNSCKIPMGLVVQAFAKVPQNENNLYVVDHGSGGPIRCNRCKAYMNPFARFVDGGRRYLCPICQCSNEVPPEYFCHLDHQGQRTDAMQRPELCFGSVEYAATKDYCKEGKIPHPPAYIFMIDVSYPSIQAGLLHLLSSSILGLLDNLPGSANEGGSPIKVGFMTYDRVIQFYNVKGSMAQPQMMVMTDVDDVFVPMVDGFLVDVSEARTVLESLLSQLPEMFSNNNTPQVILEPVVRAGMEALKAAGRNGRLFVFHSSLPSTQATGMLKNRLDTKLLGTDKEKTLLNPASSPYQKLAEECVKYGVGVELFMFPSSYCDTATLGSFVCSTGGELHYYKNFTTTCDGDRLLKDLQHSLSRPTGFDCVMRVRSSTGLRPTGFYGAFYMSNTTDIELGNIDCDKAIAVEIKHDDKLRDDEIAFFQTALLYTDFHGQRRLRIHNLSLGCSSKFPDIYRSCEIDTIINFLSKSILDASLSMPYKTIRENFNHQCAIILSCYRKHCSNQSPAGQLILPESLKLLPMYANCILKSDALLSPPIVGMDEKCWLMRCLLSMPTTLAGSFVYPRMFCLHQVDVNEKELPPLMRCTGQKLHETGLYVIENGLVMVLWIGQHLATDFIQKLFGVPSITQINTELHILPALDNPLSFRVRNILEQIQSTRQHWMKLIVTKQKDKSEVFFRRLLKEDKGAGQWEGVTYIEFLCQVHREIKEILS